MKQLLTCYLVICPILEAVNIFGGNIVTSKVYHGARYVEDASDEINLLTIAHANKLNEIANSTNDVDLIALNLGIDQTIVADAKQHLFVDEHLVQIGINKFAKGRFLTDEFLATWWLEIKDGNLNRAEEIRKLIAHEYVESKLMKEGMHYRVFDEIPTSYQYGAHELSSHEGNFDFHHWTLMGRKYPNFAINQNLDNLDNIVSQIKEIEGL